MDIKDFKVNDFIEIINVELIERGDETWENGDIVQVRDVDVDENRIDVWDKDKYSSEFIYNYELKGIRSNKKN
ncbi:hypothetical protein NST12_16715 [Bacillus sp. FSL W8-1127]|uniref:hypothetical protein n=1 Tax=Bacillus sp. FSL W8-1127 TaxID=2954710 RepID=UPI0030F60AC7